VKFRKKRMYKVFYDSSSLELSLKNENYVDGESDRYVRNQLENQEHLKRYDS
jgi:DNA-dependent RNA polymerase auxiliary subunit epsilon